MADTILNNASEIEVWSTDFFREYNYETGYAPYMGSKGKGIINVRAELVNKAGYTVNFTLFGKLTGAGVTGNSQLSGNEEAVPNYTDSVRTFVKRHAVTVELTEEMRTMIDILNVAKAQLSDWTSNDVVNGLNRELQAVIVQGPVVSADQGTDYSLAFSAATTADQDAYVVNNSDRLLFGETAPQSTMAASLAEVTSADTLSADMIDKAMNLAKRTVLGNKWAITPYKSDATAGRKWFVLFVDAQGMSDLSNDPKIIAANTDARVRGLDDNPLFQGGDLIYKGCIIREITTLPTVAANIGCAALCGLNAVNQAYSMKPTPGVLDNTDYQFRKGTSIAFARNEKKSSVKGVQTGIVNIFHWSEAA